MLPLLRATHGIFVIWFEIDAIFKSIPNQMIDCGIEMFDADRKAKKNNNTTNSASMKRQKQFGIVFDGTFFSI